MPETILDVLFKEGKLAKLDFDRYRSLLTLGEIEQALRSDNKVSSDELTAAYSSLLNLPTVDVSALFIPWSVFSLWPLERVAHLQAVPFDATARALKVAVAQPSWLKNQQGELTKKSSSGQTILYLTTPEALSVVLKRAAVPVVTLPNTAIDQAIINRFPRTVAEQHRTVAYEVSADTIRLATDEPINPKLWELIEFIEEKNQMKVELGRVEAHELERILQSYGPPSTSATPSVASASVEGSQTNLTQDSVESSVSSVPAAQGKLTIDRVEHVTQPVKSAKAPITFQPNPVMVAPVSSPPASPSPAGGLGENDLSNILPDPIKTTDSLNEVMKEGAVPKIVAALVSYGINNHASDCHIEILKDKLRIRYRIDGILHDVVSAPSQLHPPIVSRIKILGKMKIDETRIPQDGRFDVRLNGKEVDLRISTLPTVYGEKIVMRLLDKAGGIKDINKIGIEGRGKSLLLSEIKRPNGIILVTGPTGSGKSTTLYAVLNTVSTESVNIITLEDPVEYELSGVNQVQVKPKIGFTFAEGLRSVLRQDPNIIMVGEIRDSETASLATHAALTGHLVLTTLHTNDAAGSLPRLINMGIEPFLITSAMNLIIGQRLIRRLCPHCRREAKIPPEVMSTVKSELDSISPANTEDRKRVGAMTFYEAPGCDQCDHGFSGRIGIYEVMPMSDAIEAAAVAKKPASELLAIALKEGMITMRQDGFIKAISGLTTVDEILRETGNQK